MDSLHLDRSLIKPKAKILAKGVKVGTVDALDGEYLKLNRKDSDDRLHHWIPLAWIEKIVDDKIYIDHNAADFKTKRRNSKPEM